MCGSYWGNSGHMRKTKICALSLLFVIMVFMLGGCGSGTTNIDKGMAAIESREYK